MTVQAYRTMKRSSRNRGRLKLTKSKTGCSAPLQSSAPYTLVFAVGNSTGFRLLNWARSDRTIGVEAPPFAFLPTLGPAPRNSLPANGSTGLQTEITGLQTEITD